MNVASKAYLVVTESIDRQTISDLEANLCDFVILGERQNLFRKAFEIPQYIQLVGNVLFWAPLSIAAAAFLHRIATRAADDVYDAATKRFKRNNENKLEHVSEALLSAHKESEIPFSIHVVLESADNKYHTVIYAFDRYEPIEFTLDLARFVVLVDQLDHFLAENSEIVGDVSIKFENDHEASVEWMNSSLEKKSITLRTNRET